jgi:hypothetical protein
MVFVLLLLLIGLPILMLFARFLWKVTLFASFVAFGFLAQWFFLSRYGEQVESMLVPWIVFFVGVGALWVLLRWLRYAADSLRDAGYEVSGGVLRFFEFLVVGFMPGMVGASIPYNYLRPKYLDGVDLIIAQCILGIGVAVAAYIAYNRQYEHRGNNLSVSGAP